MVHEESSPLSGKEVKIKDTANELGGATILIEDYWDKVTGGSWMNADGNPAAMIYAMRTGFSSKINIPINDEVLYGKINGLGHLVHVDELEE